MNVVGFATELGQFALPFQGSKRYLGGNHAQQSAHIGRKQEKSQSNASAKARQKRKQMQQLRMNLKARSA